MWSKLTVIAVILMLASGFFAYKNYEAHQIEKKIRGDRQIELNGTNARIETETGLLNTALANTEKLKAECASLEEKNNELVEANAKITADIATKTAELDEMNKKLSDMEEKSKGMENVAELVAEIERTEQDNIRLEEELTAATAKRDALIARTTQIENSIDAVGKLENEQRAKISPESLNTSLRSVYNDWGFVVISGGADSGIVLGSKLAVYRNGEKLAELLVNNVEAGKSSADVIPSSKSPNIQLQAGDMVKAVRPDSKNN